MKSQSRVANQPSWVHSEQKNMKSVIKCLILLISKQIILGGKEKCKSLQEIQILVICLCGPLYISWVWM